MEGLRALSAIRSETIMILSDHLVSPESDVTFICGQMQNKTFSEKYAKREARERGCGGREVRRPGRRPRVRVSLSPGPRVAGCRPRVRVSQLLGTATREGLVLGRGREDGRQRWRCRCCRRGG